MGREYESDENFGLGPVLMMSTFLKIFLGNLETPEEILSQKIREAPEHPKRHFT